MRVLTVFLFLGMSTSLYAQTIETYQFKRDFLAFENDLPENTLFLVPDTTQQVLFNPARALYLNNSFFSSTLIPDFGGVQVRGANYIRQNDRGGWFISYASNIRQNDNEFNSLRAVNQLTPIVLNEADVIDNTTNFNLNQIEARIQKVFVNGRGHAEAFGLVFAADRLNQENIQSSNRDRTSIETIENGGVTERIITTEEVLTNNRVFTDEVNSYVVALEISKFKVDRDVKRRLFAQVYTNEAKSEVIDTRSITETDEDLNAGNTTVTIDNQRNSLNLEDDLRATVIGYSEYHNYEMDWFGDDFVYGNVAFFYAFGDDELMSFNERSATGSSALELTRDLSDDATLFQGNLELGYLMRKQFNNFEYFMGVEGAMQYSDATHFTGAIGSNGSTFNKNEIQTLNLNSSFPFFGKAKISDHFEVFGGVTLNYFLTVSESESNSDTELLTTNTSLSDRILVDNTSISANRNNFLGLVYKHESGFKAIANFRDNFSNTDIWRVSLVMPL